MAHSIECQSCGADVRLREATPGKRFKCPECGAVSTIEDDEPGSSRSRRSEMRIARETGANNASARFDPEVDDGDDSPERSDAARPRRKKKDKVSERKSGTGIWLIFGGVMIGLFVLLGVGLIYAFHSVGGSPIGDTGDVYAAPPEASGTNQLINSRFHPYVDQTKNVTAGLEWNREIYTPVPATISFEITSQGPLDVMVITDKAHKAMLAKKGAELKKEDILFNANSKETTCHGTCSLPSGPSHFVIVNRASGEVQFHFKCNPVNR